MDIANKTVGLFFGSFNPIHIGHLILANYILEFSDIGELWFVVSPQNPFKDKKSLLEDHHRLEMVRLAIDKYPKMRVSDIEFDMPKPSYTVDTLAYLKEKYPDRDFFLIMGEDNLSGLHRWKNAEVLVRENGILVYPRYTDAPAAPQHPMLKDANIVKLQAPRIELSATQIREMIREGKNVRPMLPAEVYDYLEGSYLYKM